ncbi:unnamed protein product, partial [Heterosigma akashiwo]
LSSRSQTSGNSTLISKKDFDDAYKTFQALHIRGYTPPASEDSEVLLSPCFQAQDVQVLFSKLNDQDKESWCVENEANNSMNRSTEEEKKEGDEEKANTSPVEFLDVSDTRQRGYCSFLVQHSKDVMSDLLSKRLPLVHLPVAKRVGSDDISAKANASSCDGLGITTTMEVDYGPCLWFFFGKNYMPEHGLSGRHDAKLLGRPEHTDSVIHDGTWHYQLSGTKIWRLRPTTELMNHLKQHKQEQVSGTKRKIDDTNTNANESNKSENNYIEVECKQGDIIVLNTRLWWHSTVIPAQNVPCISYARDIYFPDSVAAKAMVQEDGSNNNSMDQSSMTNIDGTYAAEDIEAETIIFTEHTMPNCEMHRSKIDPNCQVVELEDEETGGSYMAVVSLRDIKAGEFFCVMESDDDAEGEDMDGDEEVEEE